MQKPIGTLGANMDIGELWVRVEVEWLSFVGDNCHPAHPGHN